MLKTAMIVDDIPFARKIVKEILFGAKYSVIGEASNGAEAVAKYTELKPNFVIMDVVMPGMDGIEATRRILEKDKDARIIILSALAQEQILMEAINAGARDYIVKPFEPKDLLESIIKVLEVHDFIHGGLAHGS